MGHGPPFGESCYYRMALHPHHCRPLSANALGQRTSQGALHDATGAATKPPRRAGVHSPKGPPPSAHKKRGKHRFGCFPLCSYGIDRIVKRNGLAIAASVLCKVGVTVDITLWIRPYIVASVVADRAEYGLSLATAT